MKHTFFFLFLVQELLPRHCPQQVSKQIVNWKLFNTTDNNKEKRRNNKKREEARRLNKQFDLDPGRVYSYLKKIIETQDGIDKPKYDHGLQDEGQNERLFNDVEEATRFWKSLWETQGTGHTSGLWRDEIRSAIRDSVPEMMEEDFELSVDQAARVISKKLNTLFCLYIVRRGVWEVHTRYQVPEGATSRKLTCFAAKIVLGEVVRNGGRRSLCRMGL